MTSTNKISSNISMSDRILPILKLKDLGIPSIQAKLRKLYKNTHNLPTNTSEARLIDYSFTETPKIFYGSVAYDYNRDATEHNRLLIIKRKQQKALKTKLTRDVKKLSDTNPISLDLQKLVGSLGDKETIKLLLTKLGNLDYKNIILKSGNTNYVLNDITRNRLLKLILDNLFDAEAFTESDGRIVEEITLNRYLDISIFKTTSKYNKTQGAFFKYTNKTDMDLSRYGIFKEVISENYIDNCFITALKNKGLNELKLGFLRLVCKSRYMPMTDIPNICKCLKIKISIKKINCKNRENMVFGDNDDDYYELGLIDEHYFIIEDTHFTQYAITHYNEIKDIKNYNNIYTKEKTNYKRKNDRFISSYTLIKYLIENPADYLEKITYDNSLITSTQYYNSIDKTITNLDYTPILNVNYKPIEVNNNKLTKKTNINVFFDFETNIYNNNGTHKPYICCYEADDNTTGSFTGDDCGLKMLETLQSKYNSNKYKLTLIAHNASYDFRFLAKHFTVIKNQINTGKKLISFSGTFNKLEIDIKDSYLLITMPLRDFPDTFEISNTIKEVISYDMYNTTNCINDKMFSIDKAVEFIKTEKKDVKQFLKNIEIWNLTDTTGEYFDCIKYSVEYCKIDCLILRKGYNTFNIWMQDLVDININDCLTIASLAHRYFIETKCYDGVFQLSGIPQIFIQKCVVGGRTMVRENIKTIINNLIQALDARSLYPSAMNRLDGFLKGLPKVISNLNYDEVKNKDGYFIEVIIKSVGIKRKFPLLSFIDDNGVRQFTNDMIGKTVFIDKTTAEDIIKFQAVEFDVIRGYYFDEGFNTTIKDVIKNLYTERALKVKQENKSEIVYKLIMNSGYGKSIMKEISFKTKIFNNDDEFYVYLSRNYNYVESFNKIEGSNKIIMKVIKPINNHFNIAHVGVSILSMSKRIMNEVICLAEDNNIDIFYQDTDSMSIEYENIETLRTKFNEKYNRELIGSNMHQFGYDLKLKYTDDKGKEQKAVNVVGIKGIYVGKKTYIVELKGNKKGTGEEVLGHYIRMKGIPNSCIKYTCKKLNLNPIQLYEKLYAGDKVDFDLTEEGNKSNFKFNKDFSINTIKSGMYSRKLQFN